MNIVIISDALVTVKDSLMLWAKSSSVRLSNIEFVLPFTEDDKVIGVWIFFNTDADIDEYRASGIERLIKANFIEFSSEAGLSAEYIEAFIFVIDSEENVMENYSGSYFYRLRG